VRGETINSGSVNSGSVNSGSLNTGSVDSSTPAAASRAASTFTSEGTHRDAFERNDWGQLLFAGIVWGASFIFIAAGLDHFSPGLVTFGRIVIGTITLGLFPAARAVKVDRADWPRIALVGLTWLAFPMTLFPLAQRSISSGLAGMLNGAIPLFTAVVASIALRRLPGPNQLKGLAVGVVGVVLLGIPAMGDGGSSALGVLLVLIACMSYGFAATVSVPLAQKYGSVAVFWRCQLVAVVLTAPYGIWGAVNESTWNVGSAAALIVLGSFGTALAFLAMVALSARVGSTRAASLTYVEAVMALILGAIFRNEPIRGLEVAGCAVLLGGAWLVSRHDRTV
jgi:drug/metabolite transporter (DMT)-like permease